MRLKEGHRQLEDSKNELNSKLKGIEEATRNIKLQNEEKLKNLHSKDRQYRNRENDLKNEYNRQKMEYDRLKRENRNMDQLAKSEGQQLGEKESELSRARMDEKITNQKLNELKDLMEDDKMKLQTEIAHQESLMEKDKQELEYKTSDLEREIERSRERYKNLKADYDSLMDRLHQGLENTLQSEITGFNKNRESRFNDGISNPL